MDSKTLDENNPTFVKVCEYHNKSKILGNKLVG